MRYLLLAAIALMLLPGCKVLNPSIMLQTDKNYPYAQLTDSAFTREYRISPNDIIEFRLFSNKGANIVNLTSLATTDPAVRNNLQYLIEKDGKVKLPVLDTIKLSGLTVRQAEDTLQALYKAYYVDPFVFIKVLNKRVIVFPGTAGRAQVVTLSNNNTTLLEALALTGGIAENGKAFKVKVIRGNPEKPDVFLIDLSTMDGYRDASMVVQANDVIYVEPRKNISREVLNEVTPVLSLITSLLLVYGLFLRQ